MVLGTFVWGVKYPWLVASDSFDKYLTFRRHGFIFRKEDFSGEPFVMSSWNVSYSDFNKLAVEVSIGSIQVRHVYI